VDVSNALRRVRAEWRGSPAARRVGAIQPAGRHPIAPVLQGVQPSILLLSRRRDDLRERRRVRQREPPDGRRPACG
jgi:hypothetical protein